MKIQTIYAHPEKFEIKKLTGGYLGGAEKVTELDSYEKYILKPMGDTNEKILHSLELLEHIKGFGQNFENMTKVCDWEVQENGTLLALFEFIKNTEDRLPKSRSVYSSMRENEFFVATQDFLGETTLTGGIPTALFFPNESACRCAVQLLR